MHMYFKKVVEFHEKFGGTWVDKPTLDLPDGYKEFRIDLMKEEFDEMCESIREGDVENLGKEFADLAIVFFWTILNFWYHHIFDDIYEEVHASNMSKDPDPDGKKAIKWDSYFRADMKKFFEKIS